MFKNNWWQLHKGVLLSCFLCYPGRKEKSINITRFNTALTVLCHCWMIQHQVTLQMCAKPFFFNWLPFAVCLGFIFLFSNVCFHNNVPLFLLLDTQYGKCHGVLLWCKLCSSAWCLVHWGVESWCDKGNLHLLKQQKQSPRSVLSDLMCGFWVFFKSFNQMSLA